MEALTRKRGIKETGLMVQAKRGQSKELTILKKLHSWLKNLMSISNRSTKTNNIIKWLSLIVLKIILGVTKSIVGPLISILIKPILISLKRSSSGYLIIGKLLASH